MALTITYDGYGVVANADSLTNDTGGSGTGDWKELGGGSYSLTPDASLYAGESPPVSIGSKYASKSGYTYIDGITPLDFSGGGTEEGQYIYIWIKILSSSPLETLANNGLSIMVGSATGDNIMYPIAGSDDANEWSSDWRLFVLDPTITAGAIITGTPDISAIDTIGLWMDTATSVRAETFFISQIMCAKGLKVEGTSTTMYDDIVDWCTDYVNRAAGMFQKRGQTYYSLGSLTIHSDSGSSNVSSSGSNIEYEKSEYWNGTAWVTIYPTTANLVTIADTAGNTVDFKDTNVGISGNDSNLVSIDSSTALTFVKDGGYIKYLNTLSAASGHEFNGVVFSKYSSRSIGQESYNNCTFDGSGTLTIGSSDFANGNIINGALTITSTVLLDLSAVATNTFNGSGNNHAVQLVDLGAGSMVWNCDTTGYRVGVTGSPVTPSNSGDEDIYISVASGELTINIASGATIPSIKSAGAVINVVAGQVTADWTVNPSITGYEYALYTVTAVGSLDGASEVQHSEVHGADNFSYTYTYSAGVILAVQVIDDGTHDFEEHISYYPLSENNQSFTINLEEDTNN